MTRVRTLWANPVKATGSMLLVLAAMLVLFGSPLAADPAHTDMPCHPEGGHECCQDALMPDMAAEPSAPASHHPDPCADTDCATMSSCAAAQLALAPDRAATAKQLAIAHSPPGSARQAPGLAPSTPKQPPRN